MDSSLRVFNTRWLLQRLERQMQLANHRFPLLRRRTKKIFARRRSLRSLDDFAEYPLTSRHDYVSHFFHSRVSAGTGHTKLLGSETGVLWIELETPADTAPLYIPVDQRDLALLSGVCAEAWRSMGVKQGDFVEICDFGSSPATLLASRAFCSYLNQGASELTGATTVCNDGLATLLERGIAYFQLDTAGFTHA